MRALVLAGPFRRYLHLHRSWHHPTMNTQVLPVNPSHFKLENTTCTEFSSRNAKSIITDADDQAAINKAVQCLKEGEAVGIPTETVYGLAANALEANAVAKIFAAKNRPQDNPLIVHVSSIDMLKSILPNHTIPSVYLPVINQCWPGPLTLILPKSSIIPSSVTCNQPTVAVRFPSHPVARALIDACGFPLAAPSANSSGKPSPTLASHVLDDLHGRIPMILDGGACDVGVESTVLDGLRSPPAILRPGGVTYETLRALPGMEQLQVYRKHFVDKALELAPTTPGMKYRHYSPEAMVILVEQNNEATSHLQFQAVWRKELAALQESGVGVTRVGILRTTSDEETVRWEETKTEDSVECISLQMGRCSHPEEVARSMFKGLRELDSRSVDFIFVEGIAETQEGMAVMNRLRKAASKVIEL
ncbi:hypothetical protein DFQ28_007615 [Apophysomyces sp. BC1034]|nr:hypothetical protein DFQ30_007448 [Apophysomyces sp. BC1015]KAG0176182.1 hypothetical protein DFQ29_006443 [Apophysomyces sp. BC1021]KAG0186566.1 hypothetical protein DFQ28_007615 [Apophysomyces sp. BC1034]